MRHGQHEKGIAIRWRADRGFGGDIAGRARAVLDDELLAEAV